MVEIKPFKAYMYNTEITGDISSVIAPPWDVIDEQQEKKLFSSSRWNVIRLISQKIQPSDADRSFKEWIEKSVLVQNPLDAFYCLKHNFSYNGKNFERKGIFALLKIEDFKSGNIIPHEHVFEKYHTNRYKLIEKCHANFSPVFMLYSDAGKKIEKIIEKSPVLQEGSMNGESLRFGIIDSHQDIKSIIDILTPCNLLIADGHHRYQAAYRFFMDHPDENNRYVLVFLVDLHSQGLVILPTHRYIPYNLSFADNLLSFEQYFSVAKVNGIKEMFEQMDRNKEKHAFGIYEKGSFYVLTLKDEKSILPTEDTEKHSKKWLSLDNVILKNIILDRIFNLGEKEILYSAYPEYLLNEYSKRNEGVIVFVNPVSKETFLQITMNNEKMPHKSTYFYPKVPTGFVIHRF